MVRFDTATAQAESPSCNITMFPVLCNAEFVKNLRPILEPNWALICRMWEGCPLSDLINWQQQGGLKATLCCLLFLCFRKTACKLFFRRYVVERYCFFERVFSHFSPQTAFGDFVFSHFSHKKKGLPNKSRVSHQESLFSKTAEASGGVLRWCYVSEDLC